MPEVDWRIRQLDFGNPVDALRRHQLDCAFVADLVLPPVVEGIRSYALWQERLLLAVREDHDLVTGTGTRLGDLSNESRICGPNGLANKQWFATIRDQIPGNPRILAKAHNLEEAIEMSATGIGVTVVNESVMEMFHRPGLAFVPLSDAPTATMRLYVRSNDPSRALARFIDNARHQHDNVQT